SIPSIPKCTGMVYAPIRAYNMNTIRLALPCHMEASIKIIKISGIFTTRLFYRRRSMRICEQAFLHEERHRKVCSDLKDLELPIDSSQEHENSTLLIDHNNESTNTPSYTPILAARSSQKPSPPDETPSRYMTTKGGANIKLKLMTQQQKVIRSVDFKGNYLQSRPIISSPLAPVRKAEINKRNAVHDDNSDASAYINEIDRICLYINDFYRQIAEIRINMSSFQE
ncbi:1624_t:CDS:2, partial [Acaulospora morrowiae]